VFSILQPFFLFFDNDFPQMVVRRVLVLIQVAYMRAHTRKNRKIDLGVYLSLIQVERKFQSPILSFGGGDFGIETAKSKLRRKNF
jgi:hypothetical protein